MGLWGKAVGQLTIWDVDTFDDNYHEVITNEMIISTLNNTIAKYQHIITETYGDVDCGLIVGNFVLDNSSTVKDYYFDSMYKIYTSYENATVYDQYTDKNQYVFITKPSYVQLTFNVCDRGRTSTTVNKIVQSFIKECGMLTNHSYVSEYNYILTGHNGENFVNQFHSNYYENVDLTERPIEDI